MKDFKGDNFTMKKSIIALALALVLVVSGAVAASSIDFNGSLETNLEWHRDTEGNIETKPSSELGLNFGLNSGSEKTRAVVEFGAKKENKTGLDIQLNAASLELKKAYIETDGAFWHGGPEATTRFGSLDINYGPFAKDKNQYGVSFEDMQLGMVNLNGFYGIPSEENEQKSTQGMRANVNLSNAVAGSSVIHDKDGLHVVVDGAVKPMEDLIVGSSFATQIGLEKDEENEEKSIEHLLVVGAEYQLADNMVVHGGFKTISDGWKPAYIADKSKEDADDEGQNWVHETNRNAKGFYAGIATEQQGVMIAADYDQMFEETVLSAATEISQYNLNVETVLAVGGEEGFGTKSTKLGVDRSFNVMDQNLQAKYEGSWTAESGITHVVGTKATINMIPAVKGLELNSEVTIADKDTIGYLAGAKFNAPNGVKLGIEHIGGKYADDDVKLGTSATAGIAVKF